MEYRLQQRSISLTVGMAMSKDPTKEAKRLRAARARIARAVALRVVREERQARYAELGEVVREADPPGVFAGPIEIESSVTIPIERWLNEFPEIKQVRSNTRANVASIVVELKDRVDDPAKVWNSISSKLSDNASQLPDGCTNYSCND